MDRKPRFSIADLLAQTASRPELDEEVREAAAAREREQQARERVLRLLLEEVGRRAEEVLIEDVTDPDRGDELDAWHNHPGVNSGQQTVEVALAKNPSRAARFTERISQSGSFFQQYRGETRGRIADGMHRRTDGGGWRVLVGSGRFRSTTEPFELGERVNGAHGDFLYPADKAGIEPVVPLPIGSGDVVYPSARHILDEILADPACAFLIADICSYPHARQMRVASKVEDHAFGIAQALNKGPSRREHQLKYAVSAMANVVRVLNDRDEVVWEFNPTALNVMSLVMHTRRRSRPGMILGEQRDQKIADIEHGGERFVVKGDWYLAAQRTVDAQPE